MQASSIQIGTVVLQDFEVPEAVHFGGSYRLAVHKLSGGERRVERLGPDDDDIQFKGIFTGPTAERRARSFDNMRLSGEIVWLTWESFRHRVIIKKFLAEFHAPWWIAYQVTCVVIHQTNPATSVTAVLSTQISSDLANATLLAFGSGLSLRSLQIALANPNVLTANTSDQAQAVSASAQILNGANQQISQLSTAVTNPVLTGAASTEWSQAYASTVANAGSLAATVNAMSYVGRIATNLTSSGA